MKGEGQTMSKLMALAAFATCFGLLPLQGAWSRQMQLVDWVPTAHVIMEQNNEQYVVRFDGPVDHRTSRLEITQQGRTLRNLRPRLDSAPDVLFASGPRLPAGEYQLTWSTKSESDGDFTEGSIPFTVR
jgi:methionine-rich copper-binding protein CopC